MQQIIQLLKSPNGLGNINFLKFFITNILLLVTPIIIGISMGIEFDCSRYLRYSLLLASALSILAFVPNLIGTLTQSLVTLPLALLSIIESGHILIFKSWTTKNVFFTIFETHIIESSEFLEGYLFSSKGIILITLLVFWILVFHYFHKNGSRFKRLNSTLGLIVLISTFAILVNPKKSAERFLSYTPLFAIKAFQDYQVESDFLKSIASSEGSADFISISNDSLADQTIVVVIGESLSRSHMELYGYLRQTNPELIKIKDELLLFNNVISPECHTKQSLEKILTFRNHQLEHPKDAPNLINLAKLAGYKTFWISNQPALGASESPITAIAKSADYYIFPNQASSWEDSPPDEILLETYSKSLNDPANKKVIFLHLMGSHGMYSKRYPREYDFFTDTFSISRLDLDYQQQLIYNQYDNSVRYNDWVINQLILRLKSKKIRNSMLTYFSDHAEEVFDYRNFYGHTESIQSNFMFEIPFFIWISENHQHKEKYQFINKKHQNLLYSTEDFIHSFHNILGLTSKAYEEMRSIFSYRFKEIPRIVSKKDYQPEHYSNSYEITKNDIQFKNKFMVHRVNSLEKFREVKEIIPSIEVDIMYDPIKNIFDVYHPPAPSFGLSFEEFLKLDMDRTITYWLDFKNLDSKNSSKVIKILNNLDKQYSLKDRIVFEARDHLNLKKIAQQGFKTSWYLPTFEGKAEWEERTYIETIRGLISKEFSSLSQDYRTIKVIKKYLKNLNFITWDIGEYKDLDQKTIHELNTDEQTKIFLVKMKSAHER